MFRFLGTIRRDQRGNALMIMAAALVPVTALVGSAVDMSRVYMAKSRLQSACDSASLAARRVMDSDNMNEDVIATGTEYLNFNFPEGTYGSLELDPEFSHPEAGVVRIEAETAIPTAIMGIFGFETLPVNVACEASLNFVNTDVLLVLDVTGSMADPADDGTIKIDALREAVMALYDTLEPVQTQLQEQGLRLRYGIVPYSSTVNVGRLIYAEDPTYIRNSVTIPSRVANFATAGTPTVTYTANTPIAALGAWQNSSSSLSSTDCQSWVDRADLAGGGPIPVATTVTRYDGSATAASYVQATNWSWTGASDTSGTTRSCRRWVVVTTTTYTTTSVPGPVSFTNWTYRNETYDTTTFKTPTGTMLISSNANGTVPHPGGSYNAQQLPGVVTGGTSSSISWTGCIEERDTVTTIDGGTSLVIPASADDLDIDLIPTTDATRWRPQIPDLVYTRTAGAISMLSTGSRTSTTNWIKNYAYSQGYWACPAEAARLDEWDRDQIEDFTDLLLPIGGTYHDIGMIWGARMISPDGIFGDGCEFFNEMPCNRHVIFMTDGQQTAYCNVLTAWGVEQNDMRITGAGTCPSQLARHQQRFRMACNEAKARASVWVIAFDTSLNANLTGCASNSGQASVSTDSDDLIDRFREIGNQIGALRLTR